MARIDIYLHFDIVAANRIVDLERVTNHDVKAVEYFLKALFLTHIISFFESFTYLLQGKIHRVGYR